jgi:hypothetical protein
MAQDPSSAAGTQSRLVTLPFFISQKFPYRNLSKYFIAEKLEVVQFDLKCTQQVKLKKCLYTPFGFQELQAHRILENRHMKMISLSA